MLKLPDVTLVAIDTATHDLTKLAVEDSIRDVEFADVLLFSDRKIPVAGAENINVQNINSSRDAERFMSYGFSPYVKTSHFLIVQYDSWVTNPANWKKQFLNYDYVGAPWWYTSNNVGNGGFSLRSKKLFDYLIKHQDEYPFQVPEDDSLCRVYRPALEKQHFRWAPDALAFEFSWECVRPNRGSHFGFHGLQNWPFVLSLPQLGERMALFNEYVIKRKPFLSSMFNVLAQMYAPPKE